jgi:hydrogenase maturation protein HypF
MKSIVVYGTVQAVGFRPFVYKTAIKNNLSGYVRNRGDSVEIVVDGPNDQITKFIDDLNQRKPPLAKIDRF